MDVTGQFRPKKCVTNNKEYTMKKQGFTLIELMVVIVIMGILAAVAVPKLFGMIAKSKASEVGPAAGEYIKLQDAFVSELNQFVGNFKVIGYKMNDGNVFHYTDNLPGASSDGTTQIASTATAALTITSQVGLNECDVNSQWVLFEEAASDGNGLKWSAGIGEAQAPTASAFAQDCIVLTPSFKSLEN